MSAEPLLTSDVIGLTKVAPFSRRGFMTASAAVTAGYTLAAGPVRADVIKTDTGGLITGDAKIKVADGEMPGYFARPAGVSNPPVVLVAMEIFGLHEYIKDVTRRLAKLGAFAVAPDYYFRKGVDLTKITDIPQLLPIVNAKPDAELLSDLDSTVAWAKSQGGDTVEARASSGSAAADARSGKMPPTAARSRRAPRSTVRWSIRQIRLWPKSPTQLAPEMKAPVLGLYGEADTGIPVATGGSLQGGSGGKQEDGRVQDLSRRPARLPRRLSSELPQGRGRGRLEPDADLVQEVRGVELAWNPSAARTSIAYRRLQRHAPGSGRGMQPVGHCPGRQQFGVEVRPGRKV